MTRNLKSLYEEYDLIQGNDPIPIGQILFDRICGRLYKEKTMGQIVGLLKEFVSDYEWKGQRNIRYTVRFIFDSFYGAKAGGEEQDGPCVGRKISGPYMTVLDFLDEKCVCIMCWNAGSIRKLYEDDVVQDAWRFDYCEGVAVLRKRHGLPHTPSWNPLDIEVHNGVLCAIQHSVRDIQDRQSSYDLRQSLWVPIPGQEYQKTTCSLDIPWDTLDRSGCLSPIRGLDAVVTKQIAECLRVSESYVLDCMREGYQNSCFRSGQVGIACVDADEAVRKIQGAVRDNLGAELPLENGGTVHVPNSKTQYFSRYAVAWIILTVKGRADFSRYQMIYEAKKQASKEKMQGELVDVTWDQLRVGQLYENQLHNGQLCDGQLRDGQLCDGKLCNDNQCGGKICSNNQCSGKLCGDGQLSPIKGLGVVSKRQAATFLGISEPELQKYIVRFKRELEKLGMFVDSSKNVAQKAYSAKRNQDYSYELLLESGDWTHIPVGKYTFFSVSALYMISWMLQKEIDRDG